MAKDLNDDIGGGEDLGSRVHEPCPPADITVNGISCFASGPRLDDDLETFLEKSRYHCRNESDTPLTRITLARHADDHGPFSVPPGTYRLEGSTVAVLLLAEFIVPAKPRKWPARLSGSFRVVRDCGARLEPGSSMFGAAARRRARKPSVMTRRERLLLGAGKAENDVSPDLEPIGDPCKAPDAEAGVIPYRVCKMVNRVRNRSEPLLPVGSRTAVTGTLVVTPWSVSSPSN